MSPSDSPVLPKRVNTRGDRLSVRKANQHISESESESDEYVTTERVEKISEVLDGDENVHYLTRGSTVDVEGSSADELLFGDDRSRKSGTKGYVRTAITDKEFEGEKPSFLEKL